MTTTTVPYQASPRSLARASLAALAGGAAILALIVLPAEYGVDPTGFGRAIGLTALSETVEDDTPDTPSPAAAATPLMEQSQATIEKSSPRRSDERTVTIPAHKGVEIKAEMKVGDAFIFDWKSSGPVKMDMHGETSMTAESFTTYWKQKGLTTAQGTFTAPFAGIHGWYWRNQGEAPVTLTIRTDGFYAKLFQPKSE